MKKAGIVLVLTVMLLGASTLVYSQNVRRASDSSANSSDVSQRKAIEEIEAEAAAAREANRAAVGDIEALARLKSKAGDGNRYAEFHLGMLFKQGRGVQADESQYLFWLRRSAEHDYTQAQIRLIDIYEKGKGVPQDSVVAAGWARRAAEQGDPVGISTLTLDYFYGRGLPRNYVEAAKWYTIAVKIGVMSSSPEFGDSLRRYASPEEIAKGEALAHDWLASYQRQK